MAAAHHPPTSAEPAAGLAGPDALEIIRRLQTAGFKAVLAGGCVRDQLLGLPSKDQDIATSATPQQVAKLFPGSQMVGAAFGVVLVRLHKSKGSGVSPAAPLEVATFRSDGTYADGRRPETVTFSTIEADAARRDFTINGMYIDPLAGGEAGQLIDLVGGRADLAARLVRCIGSPDDRFAEDHLRMMRAVRFAARLGFEIEPATMAAIRAHSAKLLRIAPERIADELRRMLTAAPGLRQRAWHLLVQSGLAAAFLRSEVSAEPVAPALHAVGPEADPGVALATVWLSRTETRPDDVTTPRWAKEQRGNLRTWLKVSNDELETAERCWLALGRWHGPQPPRPSVLYRDVVALGGTAGTGEVVDLALGRSRAGAWLRAMAAFPQWKKRAEGLQVRLVETPDEALAPRPFLDGAKLQALGVLPGRLLGELLRASYDKQLDGELTDAVAAERWVSGQIRP